MTRTLEDAAPKDRPHELSPRREACDIWLPWRRRSPLGSEWPRLRLLAIKYEPSCQFFFEQRFSLLCTTSVSPPIFLKRHRGYRRPALVTGYPFLLTGNQSKKITHHDALLPEEDISGVAAFVSGRNLLSYTWGWKPC